MFGFGHMELIVLLVVVLLLFGSRLPSAMGNLGKSIVEFKKGVKGIDEEKTSGSTAESETKETTQS